MKNRTKTDGFKIDNILNFPDKYGLYSDILFALLLFLLPLRNLNVGLDLWDTGYNYSNFLFSGLEHMDPMWFFSTYLSNVIGHLFTLLPFGRTLIGLNFYTSLFEVAILITAYFFFTRKLSFNRLTVFFAEAIATSLCWCPNALLYNYMTYFFMLLCMLFMYLGLTENRQKDLFIAGIFLGLNLFVRFSNLAECAFIVVPWVFAFLYVYKEDKKLKIGKSLLTALRYTLFCVAGYLSSVVVVLGIISIKYGFSTFVDGITRLFGISESNGGYSAYAMVYNLLMEYIKGLSCSAYIFFILLVSTTLMFPVSLLIRKNSGFSSWTLRTVGLLILIVNAACICIAMFRQDFLLSDYTSYASMYRIAQVYIIIQYLACLLIIFLPVSTISERLLAGIIVCLTFITSIGSNNVLYPAINNLFIGLPFMIKKLSDLRKSDKPILYPAWITGLTYLVLLFWQAFNFGQSFTFMEAHGATEAYYYTERTAATRNVRMQNDRAEALDSLVNYLDENGLRDRELILYGRIPSLSFYLGQPAAFNPWPDLDSYSVTAFAEAMKEEYKKIAEGGKTPLVIISSGYFTELTSSAEPKDEILRSFISSCGYSVSYENDLFTVLLTD